MKASNSGYMEAIVTAIKKNDEKQTCVSVNKGIGHYIDRFLSSVSDTPAVDMPLILTALKLLGQYFAGIDPTSAEISKTLDKMGICPQITVFQRRKRKDGKQNGSNAE